MKSIVLKVVVFLLCLNIPYGVFSINKERISDLKTRFFQLQGTQADSAMVALDEILESEVAVDRAFAYAAKLYLYTRFGEEGDVEKGHLAEIESLVQQGGDTQEEYKDLTNVYNLLGAVFTKKEQFHKSLENYILAHKYALG